MSGLRSFGAYHLSVNGIHVSCEKFYCEFLETIFLSMHKQYISVAIHGFVEWLVMTCVK